MAFKSFSVRRTLIFVVIIFIAHSCNSNTEDGIENNKPLFTLLTAEQTKVDFNNFLTEKPNINVLRYEYFYNGGGVAIGDLNKDGLEDIYFTGNMVDNKLYLNKGKMQFEDITALSNVAGRPGPWKTGVTMADVDGDGNLDIYVCYSGKLRGEKRQNQLFLNKGNSSDGVPQFIDEAEKWGIADSAYSTQAAFFDYDRDGDLDMLLLNHNPFKLSNLDETQLVAVINRPEPMIGVRLYNNSGNRFDEVTGKSGLKSSTLSYGLGVAISDINNDGWPDIYISNDYDSPDYLYINNTNGTFTNELSKSIGHTSQFSMGNDVADINNDGAADIFTLDMLPEDNHRQKLLFAPDNYEMFNAKLKIGLYYQYMRNMLQLNNGNGTFSEVGQLSGISNTDWSWAALFADYDNDGWKDLFVTNGYLRDYTNMDFLKYMGDYLRDRNVMREDLLELIKKMPASNVINYMFKNNGNLTFSSVGSQWGINVPSNSNGAAYADLDNDGDLDLVVNNIQQPAFIYQNEAKQNLDNKYLKVKLEGAGKNTQGLGARVTIYSKGKGQVLEQIPTRGYQSSVSSVLHFGLGKEDLVDSLRVVWSSGKQQIMGSLKADQTLVVQEKNATSPYNPRKREEALFAELVSPIDYRPQNNATNDFKRQPLLINPLSFSGPCLIKGDINGDGLEDIFTGGGENQAGSIFIQQKSGKFVQKKQEAFYADKASTDADAIFFDADGDGFNDLYVASGGYHDYAPDDILLQDRLYLNDGKGNFTKSTHALPVMRVSKSCVRATDINDDGFTDLFVGGRVIPGQYPLAPRSYMLINDGKGRFTDATAGVAASMQTIGMVTDAVWTDVNGDKKDDLIVTGEWMPVTVFINVNGKLEDKTLDFFEKQFKGWWNNIAVSDFNHDGKIDIIVGNMGLNTQCKATDNEPAEMYYKDFDENGSIDPIFCFYIQGKSYPYVSRDELLDQMSIMRTRFTDYKSYSDATIKNVFSSEELQDAGYLTANFLKTAYFQSGVDNKFHEKSLPVQAQFSPVFTIDTLDFNKDGNIDLLLCGNISGARLRFGKYDANHGVLLQGDGKGNFSYIDQERSGFHLTGDVRSILNINNTLLFGISNSAVRAYTINKK